MKKGIILTLVLLLSFTSLTAQSRGWFNHFSVGVAGVSNFVDSSSANSLKSDSDVNNQSIIFDLGAYGMAGRYTMIGVNYNLLADLYQIDKSGYHLNYNDFHALLSLSGIHFFNKVIGRGFFARGDIGVAHRSTHVYDDGGSHTYTTGWSEWGFGMLLGGGFAVDFGASKMTIAANYSYRRIDDHNDYNSLLETNIFSFSLGLLF